ncbi:hypothetical protein STVA_24600 [Allostella vacuolata]|nr:hypothetical protein STVA_24600 [Stella vacuolata]
MRPVRRGPSPQAADFAPYGAALPFLVSRMGPYCSYCERHVAVGLAVEHVQPKNLPQYAHLVGRWGNFLLACVNCNSTKSRKDVVFADLLLPDRDNCFAAFTYTEDGKVRVSDAAAAAGIRAIGLATLALTGLDKRIDVAVDENGKQIAIDRVSQRQEAWLAATVAKADIAGQPGNPVLREYVVKLAVASGFFSIWMTVFADDPDMRGRFIDAFPGTRSSECFAGPDHAPVQPAPNPDRLEAGGKF